MKPKRENCLLYHLPVPSYLFKLYNAFSKVAAMLTVKSGYNSNYEIEMLASSQAPKIQQQAVRVKSHGVGEGSWRGPEKV